jgi:cytochrome c-type biogenesis protein CcmH/NrfF
MTVTAFVVVNARSFGIRTFDLALWASPIAALAVGLTIWRRYHARHASELPTKVDVREHARLVTLNRDRCAVRRT